MNERTDISAAAEYKQSSAAREQGKAQEILRACVRYGFCVTTCPTFVLLRDENDSPRGRIALIREMLGSASPPAAKTVEHLDRCLSCLSCMTTCAADVDYSHLIDYARIHINRTYRRPWRNRLIRGFIARTLPHPSRLAALLKLVPLGRRMTAILPAPVVAMLRLAPPAAVGFRSPKNRRSHPARGVCKARIVLLTGCVQRVIADHINTATIRVLNQAGADVVVLPGTDCCGALTLHMGRDIDGKASARATIEALYREFEREKFDAVVVNASGCGTVIKDYAHLFAGEADFAHKAREVARLCCDVTELLMRLGFPVPSSPHRHRVCYHDACSLQHGQKIFAAPRRLLTRMGYAVSEVPERHFCCGSAGTYNMLQPKIAATLGQRKAKNIESTAPQFVVAGNLGCITQIAAHTHLPVVHTIEAVDWAMGGPLPPALIGHDLVEPQKDYLTEVASGTSDVGNEQGGVIW